MQILLLVVAAALLMGNKSSTPAKDPGPQQTTTPATQPGTKTGQVVADVLAVEQGILSGIEMFKSFMSDKP
jgi:hypothetical protein